MIFGGNRLHRVVLGAHGEEEAVIAVLLEVLVLYFHVPQREPPNLLHVIVRRAVPRDLRWLRLRHLVEVFEYSLVERLHYHLLVLIFDLVGAQKVIQGLSEGRAKCCETISRYSLELLISHINNYN